MAPPPKDTTSQASALPPVSAQTSPTGRYFARTINPHALVYGVNRAHAWLRQAVTGLLEPSYAPEGYLGTPDGPTPFGTGPTQIVTPDQAAALQAQFQKLPPIPPTGKPGQPGFLPGHPQHHGKLP